MDSVEAALELHGLQMEFIKSEMKGFKDKVNQLEGKDAEILGDLSKLDKRISELGVSVSFVSQTIKVFLNFILSNRPTANSTNESAHNLTNSGYTLFRKEKNC